MEKRHYLVIAGALAAVVGLLSLLLVAVWTGQPLGVSGQPLEWRLMLAGILLGVLVGIVVVDVMTAER